MALASTQEGLDIEDIREGYVLLKNNGAAAVIQTTAVNFDLLSEIEQDAMIAGYSQFLNSLTFPIQIVIRSKKMDISSYVESLESVEQSQTNPYLREQIKNYRGYVSELISKNEVLDKRFYVVVPYQDVSLKPEASIFSAFLNFLGLPQKKAPRVNRRALLDKGKIQLEPKVDLIIKQLSRVGIKAKKLDTQELVELFYDIYNPYTSAEERLRGQAAEYTAPLVQAAVEGQ
ncbi:MAG: hypothetical protein M1352_01370 [Patescibacteria group bacterium]|nr:hypothetical protein [Patescibacteria group bacterium]